MGEFNFRKFYVLKNNYRNMSETILSFDVGIRNLAYCCIRENTILSWGVLDLGIKMNSSTEAMTEALVKTLDANEGEFTDATKIIIEKQPARNPKMRYIEGMICTYFYIKGVQQGDVRHVRSYSPKYKLGKNTHKGLSNYAERKKLGVRRCKAFLEQTADVNRRMSALFDKSKKKDDLSDSLLQALSYVEHPMFNELQEPEKGCVFNDVRARKPTDKQRRTKKYSRANIKYIIGNDPTAISDQHVRKAFVRLFGQEPEEILISL